MENQDIFPSSILQNKNNFRKQEMQDEVTIWDTSYSANEEGYNFMAFRSSKTPKDPLVTISKGHWGFEDEQDELLGIYN